MFLMVDTIIVSRKSNIHFIGKGWKRRRKKFGFYFAKKFGPFRVRKYSYGQIHLEFSAPKVLYNNNRCMYQLSDYKLLKSYFESAFFQAFGELPPDLATWQVCRIDYCCNFIVEQFPYSESALEHLLDFTKKSSWTRCKKDDYETGAFCKNKRRSIKIYNKAEERLKHEEQYKFDKQDLTARAEICLRQKAIAHDFGPHATFRDLVTPEMSKKYIDKILKAYHLDKPLKSRKEVFIEIASKIKSKRQRDNLIKFVKEVNSSSIDEVKAKNRSRFYYYSRILRQHSIPLLWVTHRLAGCRLAIAPNPSSYNKKQQLKNKMQKNQPIYITYGLFVIYIDIITIKEHNNGHKIIEKRCRSPSIICQQHQNAITLL